MNTYIYTFGCKVNQVESEKIINDAASRGFSIVDDPDKAELVIINSCAVTEKAEKKFKSLVKKLKSANEALVVAVTGCAVEKDKDKLKSIGADIVVTNSGKTDILTYIASNTDWLKDISEPHTFISAENDRMKSRTRAFIKIQDGCDSGCAYCIIPSLRGLPVSRDEDSIMTEVRHLVDNGYKEIVPVGIHVGKYGYDLSDGTDLTGLLRRMLAVDGYRIRLTSIELNEMTDELIRLITDNQDRICRHYHIPLQSGSTEILRKMKRHYTAEEYIEKAKLLKKLVPDCTLGADIIVGFPGETEENFLETMDTVKKAGIDHLHVFSYSDRTGTAASRMTDKVDAKTKADRSKRLHALAAEMKRVSADRMVGKKLSVLTQDANTALSDNFFMVIFPFDVESNTLLDVKVTDVGNDNTLKAEIIEHEQKDSNHRGSSGGSDCGR